MKMNRPRYSEETISSVAKTTLTNARINFASLSDFAITEESINEFYAEIQAAESLPGETQNRIDLGDLTYDKEEALDSCYQWGRKLIVRLHLAFGKDSVQAKSFPSKDSQITVNSENAMMTTMEIRNSSPVIPAGAKRNAGISIGELLSINLHIYSGDSG